MSDSTQKPIDQSQIPAGVAPAEVPKPREPSHEEILKGLGSQAKEKKALSERLVQDAEKVTAVLEARKEAIASAAKVKRDDALERTAQEKKESESFLHDERQENLHELHTAAENAKKDLNGEFETLKANLSDPSAIEQIGKDLADKMKEIDDIESKADANVEEEFAANMKALEVDSAEMILHAENEYVSAAALIEGIDKDIAIVKTSKESKLKELWSSKLEEKVADEVVAEQPVASEEAVKKAVVSSGMKWAAIGTGVFLAGYFGLKHVVPSPEYFQPSPKVFVSSVPVPGALVAPLASTGLAGVRKPEAKTVKTVVKEVKHAVPVAAKLVEPKKDAKAALKPVEPKKAVVAPKSVKKAVEQTGVKKVAEKKGVKAAIEKKEVKKAVDARKVYVKFTRAILTIWPEIKTYNASGTVFQKSPKESLKAFCTYATDNAGKLSTEQRAAIAELLFVIRDAKKVGALGLDEWEITPLNKIRKGKMDAGEIKKLTNDFRKAIKDRKAHLTTDKKSKKANAPVTVPAQKAAPAMKPAAPKAAKGVKAEPLMKGATVQKTAAQ